MIPLRIQVFGTSDFTIWKGKKQTTVQRSFGFDLWNPEQQCGVEARLPTAGSFLWPGLHAARRAALAALQMPGIEQVAIKTNQDKRIATLYRSKLNSYLEVG
jgi:hypothetical protein